MWYIDPNLNGGYPTNTEFLSPLPAGFTDDANVNLPARAWRITSGINGGYPYNWFVWAAQTGVISDPTVIPGSDIGGGGGSGSVQMDIGGRRTNFPGGLHNLAGSLIPFDTNGSVFNDNPSIGVFLAGALKSYAATPGAITSVRDDILSFCQDITNTIHNQLIGLSGTGLTDIVLQCKIYPFDLPNDGIEPQSIELIRFSSNIAFTLRPNTGTTLKMAHLSNTVKLLDFGVIDLQITQGWELDGINWSLYLPYAGTYSVQIDNTQAINLKCVVDILSGQCEYYLLADDEIIFSASGKMGVDIPFNLSQAEQQQNLNGWRTNQLVKGLSFAAGATKGKAGAIASKITDAAQTGLNAINSGNVSVNAPSIGGGVGFATPQKPRLIAHMPEMQKDGIGYAEIIGTNKRYAQTRLGDTQGYVRCNNYKCEVIIATTREKLEIERLLNEGVFI